MSFRKSGIGPGQQVSCAGCRRNPKASIGQLPHWVWAPTQPEEGQAESMSVSIETITAQGKALGCTGTWGLQAVLLPAPGPGMAMKARAQTCTPRKSWQDLGFKASSGAQLLVGWAVCCQKQEKGQVRLTHTFPGDSCSSSTSGLHPYFLGSTPALAQYPVQLVDGKATARSAGIWKAQS